MTNTQKAIEDSVKGGFILLGDRTLKLETPVREYRKRGNRMFVRLRGNTAGIRIPIQEILLDPLFWQCLGKERGWKLWMDTGYHTTDETAIQDYSWRVHWHSLIDALAYGRSIEDFFTSLAE